MAFLSIMARFGMDSTGFKAGIKQAESATKGLSRDLNSNLKGAIAGAFGTAAIIAAGKATLDYAGQINDLSDRLGISTDALQEFDFAARMTGSNLETFTGFLEKLSVARESALEGNEEMTASFARLGVSLSDLRTKRLDELTRQIGRAVQGGDAQALLPALKGVGGKSAAALIPAFKGGLDELGQQARDSGAIISPEDIAALDEAGDRFSELVQVLRAGLAPAVAYLADAAIDAVYGVRAIGAALGEAFAKFTPTRIAAALVVPGGITALARDVANTVGDSPAAAAILQQREDARQTAREATAARAAGQSAPLAAAGAGALDKLRAANLEKEEKLLPAAERRAKIEERIAVLKKQVMFAEEDVAVLGTEEAKIALERLRGKLLDAQAQNQAPEAKAEAIQNKPADPMVNALERIGFSFGKTTAKPEVRHLESISKGVSSTNAKLDKLVASSALTADALA